MRHLKDLEKEEKFVYQGKNAIKAHNDGEKCWFLIEAEPDSNIFYPAHNKPDTIIDSLMTDAQIVKELLKSYECGDTGIYHNNWFMVKISDELREELSKRLNSK